MMAFFHAYKFTHFAAGGAAQTQEPGKLSPGQKIGALVFGISNPRPTNEKLPAQPFETIRIFSNKEIECWSIKTSPARGTVILFHGYMGHKSVLLEKAGELLKLGYNTLLVDFMGSGGSAGNQTTIGFLEAAEVKSCVDYLKAGGEENIYLFGTSMGAVAIMKAIDDYRISPRGIILECPFGSMYETVENRFQSMHIPAFPMAGLLIFWGGIQNGFWAFGHNPAEYAKRISCPVVLMYGSKDDKVARKEIDAIFANLQGKKSLKIYAGAGHSNYFDQYQQAWIHDVGDFLSDH